MLLATQLLANAVIAELILARETYRFADFAGALTQKAAAQPAPLWKHPSSVSIICSSPGDMMQFDVVNLESTRLSDCNR